MAILTERKVWHRPRPTRGIRAFTLTEQEQLNVKRALRALRDELGSWRLVAERLGCDRGTVKTAARAGLQRSQRPSPGMAIAVARAAGVAVEDVLSGVWPG